MDSLTTIDVPRLTFDCSTPDKRRRFRMAYYIGEDGETKTITLYCADAEFKAHCEYLGLAASVTKKCNSCHGFKPLSEFSKRTQLKDGVNNICKPCDRARGGNTTEEIKKK